MDSKIFKAIVYFFLAIMAIFVFFMTVNFFGNSSRGSAEPKRGRDMSENVADVAKYQYPVKPPLPHEPEPGAEVRSEGAISIVREKEFNGVAERPKSMMATLTEMSGDRGKPAPIRLKDSDLEKKIEALAPPGREPSLKGSSMPEMGRQPGNEGITLLSAPVDYKVFKSSAEWRTFTDSRDLEPVAHDFSSENLLILVSVSEFPSGIFKIVEVEKSAKETVIKYRVDPLSMSSEGSPAAREAFSATPIPRKGPPVRLQQVP